MIPNLTASRIPTLAEAATIGNPAAQQAQAESLAELLAQYQQNQANLQRAEAIDANAAYIPNSGALGVLASLANRYMGGRIRRQEGENAKDLAVRIFEAEKAAKRQEAMDKAEQESAAERASMAQRRRDAERLGIRGDAANRYELTGDLPAAGRTTPVWTNQGLMAYDPTTGTYSPAQMAGADGRPVSIDIDPNTPTDERAAIMGAIQADMMGQDPQAGAIRGATAFAGAGMPTASPNAPLAPYEKPRESADSDLERRLRLAREMGASDAELRQMVIGREGAAAGAKPIPTGALKMIQEETNAANTADAINAGLQKHLARIESGRLNFGPVSNVIAQGRNFAGMSTQESRNFQEFKSDLERLRNESLRLNSGVQTDGDAQRAWNELFANLNDEAYVKQRLQTIATLNQRARELRLRNVEMVRENYGRGEGAETAPPPAAPRPALPPGFSWED